MCDSGSTETLKKRGSDIIIRMRITILFKMTALLMGLSANCRIPYAEDWRVESSLVVRAFEQRKSDVQVEARVLLREYCRTTMKDRSISDLSFGLPRDKK